MGQVDEVSKLRFAQQSGVQVLGTPTGTTGDVDLPGVSLVGDLHPLPVTVSGITADINVDTISVDTNGYIGKPSGGTGDFVTSYITGNTIRCAGLPTGLSAIRSGDIITIVQINSAGAVVNTYSRDDVTIVCTGTDPTLVTVTSAIFSSGDSFIIYTNIPRPTIGADIDDRVFTPASGRGQVVMGAATTDLVDANDQGVLRMTTARNLGVDLSSITGTPLDIAGGAAGAGTLRTTLASDDVNASAIKAAVEIMDDWDDADRCNVNLITGQTGVTANIGVADAGTIRTALATDDVNASAIKAAVEIMDDWDDADRCNVNLITGQTGVTANIGVADAGTIRTALATDDVNASAIKAAVEIMDDWDDANRCNVNLITGQTGVTANVGVADAGTPRVALARNARGSILPANYISPYDFAASFTTNVTITCVGAPFTVDDINCTVIFVQVKPSGSTWGAPYVNGMDGISLSASGNVITIAGAGTPLASGDTYHIGVSYQKKAYDATLDMIKAAIQNPESNKTLAENIIDTTNVTGINYYPTSLGKSMAGFKDWSMTGTLIDADNTITLTVEVTNDEDTTNANWIQVYFYDRLNNTTGTSISVNSGTTTFACEIANLNYDWYRYKIVACGNTNTQIVKERRKAL